MSGYYFKFSDFLKQRYGQKVWKISIDAGFSCPHKAEGGCIFCRNDSFSKLQSLQNLDINTQIQHGLKFGKEKMGIDQFIVYFQSSTNTFAPVSVLREYFYQAISFKNVVGLSIATRPDCISDSVLNLLDELSGKIDLWIELGLQSIHDRTLQLLNRGHNFKDYAQAVIDLLSVKVRICTHIMIGLPEETRSELLQTAQVIAHNSTHEVKLHPLLILRDTPLERIYQDDRFSTLELDDYIQYVCDFLERLPPGMVIQRLTAEAPKEQLLAPFWTLNKLAVLRGINEEFEKRKTKQGEFYIASN